MSQHEKYHILKPGSVYIYKGGDIHFQGLTPGTIIFLVKEESYINKGNVAFIKWDFLYGDKITCNYYSFFTGRKKEKQSYYKEKICNCFEKIC